MQCNRIEYNWTFFWVMHLCTRSNRRIFHFELHKSSYQLLHKEHLWYCSKQLITVQVMFKSPLQKERSLSCKIASAVVILGNMFLFFYCCFYLCLRFTFLESLDSPHFLYLITNTRAEYLYISALFTWISVTRYHGRPSAVVFLLEREHENSDTCIEEDKITDCHPPPFYLSKV